MRDAGNSLSGHVKRSEKSHIAMPAPPEPFNERFFASLRMTMLVPL
jgi:hypothetical protein